MIGVPTAVPATLEMLYGVITKTYHVFGDAPV